MFESVYEPDKLYLKILRNRIKLHYSLKGLDEDTIEIMVALMNDDTVISLNRVLLDEHTRQQ